MCRYGVKIGENFDQSWGGLPVVIFLGDDVQLSPVLDSPVLIRITFINFISLKNSI
jgi:hypothetical protein